MIYRQKLFFVFGLLIGMTGAASLEFGMLGAQAAVAAKAGTHGLTAVEGHKAAFRLAASTLHSMTAGIAAARCVRRFFRRGTVVADGAARLMMAGVTGDPRV